MPFGAIDVLGCGILWIPQGAFSIECSEHNAISMLSLCVSEACTQSLEPVLLSFFCVFVRKKNKTTRRSLTVCAQSLTAHDVGKLIDDALSLSQLHCARDVARFDVRRAVVIQPEKRCLGFSDRACTRERHKMKSETSFSAR